SAACAAARWAQGPSRRAFLPAGSQCERQHERVFATVARGVIVAPHGDLAKAVAVIKSLRPPVARPHLEKHVLGAELARERRRFIEQSRAIATALMRLGDREIEQMRLARGCQHHEVADQLAIQPESAAFVARAQRIGEVASRPRMRIERAFDRHHLGEIVLAHRGEDQRRLENGAHLAASSSRVKATLSRTYMGTAAAASTPSPAASRGAASCATASAVGCTSGSTLLSPRFPYTANPLPAPIQSWPGNAGAAAGAMQRGLRTCRQRRPSFSSAA